MAAGKAYINVREMSGHAHVCSRARRDSLHAPVAAGGAYTDCEESWKKMQGNVYVATWKAYINIRNM